MTADSWLTSATKYLDKAGISTARLDALVLLEDITGIDRAKLLAEPDLVIEPVKLKKLKNLLNRRARHEPLAYVRGKSEFYGRMFVITPAVLEPRPESETMIDELKKLPDLPEKPLIADVGTGSGALGITAKLELPDAEIELIDIDSRTLKVARTNVDLFTLVLSIIKSDLLANARSNYDVLLCNLPYVPDHYEINLAASHEPRLAIFGGPDGLDLYRKLFSQLQNKSSRPLYILSEALPPQHGELQSIAHISGYELVSKNDFIQVFKRAQN